MLGSIFYRSLSAGLIMFFLPVFPADAQNWIWARQGSSQSESFAVCTDYSGNVYSAGYFSGSGVSFGSSSLVGAGGKDIFLVKYDPNGNVIWARQAGGNSDDRAHAVACDAQGNVYITGTYYSPTLSFGATTLTNSGSWDLFVAKYDPSGNFVWANGAKGVFEERGLGISISSGGEVFVTGFYMSPTMDIGTFSLINADPAGFTSDLFLLRYDGGGNLIWANRAGQKNNDAGCSVAADGGGNAFVSGYFSSPSISFGVNNLTNAGSYDIFLTKYDVNGNVSWAKSAGGAANEVGYSVSTDPAGNVFMTGMFESNSISFGSATLSGTTGIKPADVFLVKYNSSGNVVWARSAGGVQSDFGYSVSSDASGNAFITGFFGSPSITFGSTSLTFPSGNGDPVFVAKYSPSGQALCASKLISGGHTNNSICSDAAGNAYVGAGFQSAQLLAGSDTLVLNGPIGAANAYVAKFNCFVNILSVVALGNNPPCNGLCNGSAAAQVLNGTAPYTYQWSTSPVETSASITGLCPGNYSVLVTDASGTTATTTVTIYQPAALTLSTTTSSQCNNQSNGTCSVIANGGTAPYVYAWSNGTTTSALSGLTSGSYSVVVTDSKGCSIVASATIVSFSSPTVFISGDTILCSGESSLLSGNGGLTYVWNNGVSAASISVSTAGSFSVVATDANGCTSIDSVVVLVYPKPQTNVSGNVTLNAGETATLTATGGPPYIWNNGSSDSVIIVTPGSTQQYCVTVQDSNNCSSKSCITVYVEPLKCPDPYVPNAFSPNSDGENDAFKLYSDNFDCIQKVKLSIYNMWGEKVFESDDPHFSWNGENISGMLRGTGNSAVYVYKLYIELTTGTVTRKKGNITLLR